MFDEKNIDEATKLSKTMMSYWAEFAYNGDPAKGRKGDLIRWETWNNLENENKFLIIDTPQDGGVRRCQRGIGGLCCWIKLLE